MTPDEDADLPRLGVGITNVCARPTRAAAELTTEELREGGAELERLVAEWQPRVLAVLGMGAYRTAFGVRDAALGLQDLSLGGRPVWVLPNPSGLNAHYQLPALARLYAQAREFALGL
jgi:TDG/mug DNA glycosylase family protein